MRIPADHARDLRDRFLLHARARTPAVERVVVRVYPHRERRRKPRDGMRGLEHLARVERVEIREVVGEAGGNFVEDALDRRGVRLRHPGHSRISRSLTRS